MKPALTFFMVFETKNQCCWSRRTDASVLNAGKRSGSELSPHSYCAGTNNINDLLFDLAMLILQTAILSSELSQNPLRRGTAISDIAS
jgi:hypothetical protein